MNQKYAAIILAAIMVLSVFSYFVASFVGNTDTGTDEENTTTDFQTQLANAPGFDTLGGTLFSAQLDSVSDGLAFSPEGMSTAVYVDYSKTYGSPLQNYNITDLYMYYNTLMVKRFSAYNLSTGSGFEAHVLNPEVLNFNYTIANTYNGYPVLYRATGVYNVMGSPTLLGDEAILEKVIDVKSGTSPASSDFSEILSYVEPGAEYQWVSSADELADQHYVEFRNMNDGNYSKTDLFLNPNSTTVEMVNSYEANSSLRGLAYNTTFEDDGKVLKVVVETNTSNFINLITEDYR